MEAFTPEPHTTLWLWLLSLSPSSSFPHHSVSLPPLFQFGHGCGYCPLSLPHPLSPYFQLLLFGSCRGHCRLHLHLLGILCVVVGVVYHSPGSRNVISIFFKLRERERRNSLMRLGGATSWPRRFPVVMVPITVVSVGLGLNSSSVERNIVRREKCVYEEKKNSPGFHPEHPHVFQ